MNWLKGNWKPLAAGALCALGLVALVAMWERAAPAAALPWLLAALPYDLCLAAGFGLGWVCARGLPAWVGGLLRSRWAERAFWLAAGLCLALALTRAHLPLPGPPEPPVPPAPIPTQGLRVLVVYEGADLSKLPKAQGDVLASPEVRGYLSAKCVKGPDGKTPEWRFFDKDVDTSGESKVWQDAMRLPRTGLPWLVISDGRTGYSGPLPADSAATLALLKKYGG